MSHWFPMIYRLWTETLYNSTIAHVRSLAYALIKVD